MRISDWSSDVCSSDLRLHLFAHQPSVIDHRPLHHLEPRGPRNLFRLWSVAQRAPAGDGRGLIHATLPGSKENPMRLMLAALCLSFALQLPSQARSAVEGVWLFDDAPSYPGVTMLEVADDAGVIRSEVHTSELTSLMRISYAVFS